MSGRVDTGSTEDGVRAWGKCGTDTGIGWRAGIEGLFLERVRETTSDEVVTQA